MSLIQDQQRAKANQDSPVIKPLPTPEIGGGFSSGNEFQLSQPTPPPPPVEPGSAADFSLLDAPVAPQGLPAPPNVEQTILETSPEPSISIWNRVPPEQSPYESTILQTSKPTVYDTSRINHETQVIDNLGRSSVDYARDLLRQQQQAAIQKQQERQADRSQQINIPRKEQPWFSGVAGYLRDVLFGSEEHQKETQINKRFNPLTGSFGVSGAGVGGAVNYILSTPLRTTVGAIGEGLQAAKEGLTAIGVPEESAERFIRDGFLGFIPGYSDFRKKVGFAVDWDKLESRNNILDAITAQAEVSDINDPAGNRKGIFYRPQRVERKQEPGLAGFARGVGQAIVDDPVGGLSQIAIELLDPAGNAVGDAIGAGISRLFKRVPEVVPKKVPAPAAPASAVPRVLALPGKPNVTYKALPPSIPQRLNTTVRPEQFYGTPTETVLRVGIGQGSDIPIAVDDVVRLLPRPRPETVSTNALPAANLPPINPNSTRTLGAQVVNQAGQSVQIPGRQVTQFYDEQFARQLQQLPPGQVLPEDTAALARELTELPASQQTIDVPASAAPEELAPAAPVEQEFVAPAPAVPAPAVPASAPSPAPVKPARLALNNDEKTAITAIANRTEYGKLWTPILDLLKSPDKKAVNALVESRAEELFRFINERSGNTVNGYDVFETTDRLVTLLLREGHLTKVKPALLPFIKGKTADQLPPLLRSFVQENFSITKKGAWSPVKPPKAKPEPLPLQTVVEPPKPSATYYNAPELPQFSWQKPKAGRGSVTRVNPRELDKLWLADRVDKGGQRYQQAQEFFRTTKEPVLMPEIAVNPDGSINFVDGGNRFAALRDAGYTDIPVLVRNRKNLPETVRSKPPLPPEPVPVLEASVDELIEQATELAEHKAVIQAPLKQIEQIFDTTVDYGRKFDDKLPYERLTNEGVREMLLDGASINLPKRVAREIAKRHTPDLVKGILRNSDDNAAGFAFIGNKRLDALVDDIVKLMNDTLDDAPTPNNVLKSPDVQQPAGFNTDKLSIRLPKQLSHGTAFAEWTPNYNVKLYGSRGELGSGLYLSEKVTVAQQYAKAVISENVSPATNGFTVAPKVVTLTHELKKTLSARAKFDKNSGFVEALLEGLPQDIIDNVRRSLQRDRAFGAKTAEYVKATDYVSVLNKLEAAIPKSGLEPTEEVLSELQNTISDNLRKLGFDSVYDSKSGFAVALDSANLKVAKETPVGQATTSLDAVVNRYNADAYAAKYYPNRLTTDSNLRDSAYKLYSQLENNVDNKLAEVQQAIIERDLANLEGIVLPPRSKPGQPPKPATVRKVLEQVEPKSINPCDP